MHRSLTTATFAAAAIVLSVAPGCSSDNESNAGADPETTIVAGARAGAGAPVIEGAFNESPKITIGSADLAVGTKGVVIEGQGAVVSEGDQVVAQMGAYTLEDTTALGESWADRVPLLFELGTDEVAADIAAALTGVNAGSRVWAVVPASDAGGDAGGNVLVVVDILSAYAPTASVEGTEIASPTGYPVVTAEPGAKPAVAAATAPAPTVDQRFGLIVGTGTQVWDERIMVLQYVMTEWATGTEVDSTWKSVGGPMFAPWGAGKLPARVDAQLRGVTAGSRVMVVIPPAADGSDPWPTGLGLDKTKTYVVTVDVIDVVELGAA